MGAFKLIQTSKALIILIAIQKSLINNPTVTTLTKEIY